MAQVNYPAPPFPEQQQNHQPGKSAQMDPPPDHGERTYKGSGRLSGKIALITGADSGIGRAVAIAFAREGADVAIAYLNEEEDANETARWVTDAGQKSLLLPGDITEPAHCRDLVQKTVDAFGRIDVLVNNAGISMRALFNDVDLGVLKTLMNVNYWGTVYCTKYALPEILKTKGSIVGVSSIAGYKGLPGRTGTKTQVEIFYRLIFKTYGLC